MAACQRVKLSEVITQNTDIERITNTKSEHYITLALYGKGARERHIKDEKYPVPFLGYRVTAGQFIYSRIDARNGAYGIIGKSLDGFVVSKDFPVYNIDTSKILPQFLLRSVLSRGFVEQVKQSSFGATNRMRIKEEVFENYYISLPSLEVQKLIVDRLGRVSAVIASREKEVTLLDELVKARFIELFGDPVYNSKRLPIQRLCKLGSLDRGRSQHRPRNDPKLLNGPYPLIQTGEVASAGLYITKYKNTYSELGLRQSKMWSAGTLCITIAANIAQTAILTFDACFPDSVVGFLPNDSINAIYMHYWFGFFQKILEKQAPQVAQKNINLKILSELNVIVPTQEKQEQFAAFVEQTDKSKVAIQKALDEAQLLFDSLMQKYFG